MQQNDLQISLLNLYKFWGRKATLFSKKTQIPKFVVDKQQFFVNLSIGQQVLESILSLNFNPFVSQIIDLGRTRREFVNTQQLRPRSGQHTGGCLQQIPQVKDAGNISIVQTIASSRTTQAFLKTVE